jgi:hypothetical protein
LRIQRLSLGLLALALVSVSASQTAEAASKSSRSSNSGGGAYVGLGVGEMLPQGDLAEFNDPSYFVQSRSLYVEKVFGGRAAAYYGDTAGSQGVDGGRVYGFDFDVLVKLGSARAFGYLFGGVGYGSMTFTVPDPATGLPVRQSDHDWCWTGGVGFSFRSKHGFYIEASYVSYQTNPKMDFVPIVVGFQF